MLPHSHIAPVSPAEWLGDPHPLAEQIGSADGLAALGSVSESLQVEPVRDLASLRLFLHHYQAQILLPLELPAITNAFGHGNRNELRELLALDNRLGREPVLQPLASASQRVGQNQLEQLRPLKDHRLVQRYLAAVQRGEARCWHTLVYGLTLAIYSLPLRQGLHGYAQRALLGFITAAGSSINLSETEVEETFSKVAADLNGEVEKLLAQKPAA